MIKERNAKSYEMKLHYAVCSWETLNFKEQKITPGHSGRTKA